MKKFLLGLCIILLSSSATFATTVVNYNQAGVRTSVAYGASAPVSAHTFGTNALFAPTTTARRSVHPAYANANHNKDIKRGYATGNYAKQKLRRPAAIASAKTIEAVPTKAPATKTVRTPRVVNGVTYYN
jgi:hypothetical protein